MAIDTEFRVQHFFFLCYGNHRDLHSFPTRRSSDLRLRLRVHRHEVRVLDAVDAEHLLDQELGVGEDRKSTRLNSSHSQISYAVFCLKKKTKRFPFGGCLPTPEDQGPAARMPPRTSR